MEDFEAKRNALFACLDNASKELSGTALDQSQSANPTLDLVYRRCTPRKNRNLISPDKSLSRMRGKESIFKKPEMPLSKCLKPRKVPDFKVNPQKWTKYSLADVDISDHTNTAAAFEFLKQMDEQLEARERQEGTCHETNAKIEFKKSSKIRKQMRDKEEDEVKDAEIDKPRLKGSRVVMPEYVVGQQRDTKKKKHVKSVENQTRAAGTLRLDHLQEDDEDTEEG
uniref:U5 small nuclear ribonucleoprotein TSSC4 n=1 Tax=Bactrocera dorsalis TaxID=27457 RepID=A0A034VRT8_BACDO